MIIKKHDDLTADRMNKYEKKPKKKRFLNFFRKVESPTNISNLESSVSVNQKIFNKSENKKNISYLRMLDFEKDEPNEYSPQNSNPYVSIMKYVSFIIYIASFILYKSSLFSCKKLSLNDCINKYNLQDIFQDMIKCISSGFILSANLTFILLKLISIIHLFLMLIFIIILLIIDSGNNIYNHGIINFYVFFIGLALGFLIIVLIQMSVLMIISKKYKKSAILICLTIIIFICIFLVYNLLTSCSYWDKGLDSIQIDNDKNKYSCKIERPQTCYINAFNNLFDFSSISNYKCELQNDHNYNEILNNYNLYYDMEFNDNTTVLNFPLTNNDHYSIYNQHDFAKYVIGNIKGDKVKDTQNSEIFLVKENNKGKIEMKINRNNILINERKNLEKENSKIKNVLFIYIDTLSRAHFHRKFITFSNLLSDLFKDKHNSFESFEFLKYHNFDDIDSNLNIQPMFFGTNDIKLRGENHKNIISIMKENGFITAQSSNKCSKDLISLYPFELYDEFDHENIAMFCDPSYYNLNPKTTNIKGINSVFKRCLFGLDSYKYIMNYGKLFWETYKDSKKFLRLGFFDGNERSGEVIKYLDEDLTEFVLDLVNNGRFYRTALFLVGNKGGIDSGIYETSKTTEFISEMNLGSWFIILYKKGLDNQIIENLRNNMQIFVTPYDIYDSLLSLVYNCYDNDCDGKMKYKSIRGNSVFQIINDSKRNCDNYPEIESVTCKCIKY